MLWLVDPASRTITVYRARRDARVLSEEEMLEGAEVLEGFSVQIAELFRWPGLGS